MTQCLQAACGFLNLLKPPGMTSAHAVGVVRRAMGGVKIGHAGTLDPQAAGVLPLMIGKAARLFDLMQDKEKEYIAEVAFGAATDTQDAQGVVVETSDHFPDEIALRAVLPRFTGQIMQRPPMVSALKVDGQRLYDVARRGGMVEIAERPVTVHELTLLQMMPRHGALLRVRCSKGFYVRTLCHDLGQALGCPAHMRFLLRAQSGPFTLDTAVPLEAFQAAAQQGTTSTLLLPMETAVGHVPMAQIPPQWEKAFRNGVPLPASAFAEELPQNTPIRLYIGDALMAIGEQRAGSISFHTWLGD